ncbi:BNR repeat-containing glycosyl hydrolase [metagenome]
MKTKIPKKFLIITGIVIIGIAIAFSFNDQKPMMPDIASNTRTVDWRHVHGLGVDPTDSSILYIATHGDFYQSRNGALPVKVDQVRADYMAFNAPHDKDSPLYASGHPSTGGNTGLIKSMDGGITWQSVSKVLDPPVDFHAMTLSKSDPNLILGFDSGARGLFKTIDAGKTWESVEYPEYISALAISPTDSQLIFAGTGNGIYKSNDGGITWTHVAYQGLAVYAMNFDDDGILFASVNTFGLVRSDDLGVTWSDLADIDLTITSIAFDSPNKILYINGFSPEGYQEVYKLSYDITQYEMIGTNKGLK